MGAKPLATMPVPGCYRCAHPRASHVRDGRQPAACTEPECGCRSYETPPSEQEREAMGQINFLAEAP